MTARAAGALPAGLGSRLTPVSVPRLGRMVIVPAVLAHAFALAGLLGGWSVYRLPAAAALLFAVSVALPVVLVLASRRPGGLLPAWAAAGVVAGVFAVSAALPVLLPPDARASMQSWNWGTGAMTLLGVAAYLPIRLTLLLAAAHAGLAVTVQLLSGGGLWEIDLMLVSTLVPPLGAAQYLRFYADALRQRAIAAQGVVEADAGRRELDVVRVEGDRRLGDLRDEIEPVLELVAAGAPLPLDDVQARHARRLAERLREALVAERRALWLPARVGSAAVTVVAPEPAGRRLGTGDRAWLAALLDLLGNHAGWRSVRVVLDPLGDGRVSATITAEGTAAAQAALDPRIRALASARGARTEIEGVFLSIDADLHLTSGA